MTCSKTAALFFFELDLTQLLHFFFGLLHDAVLDGEGGARAVLLGLRYGNLGDLFVVSGEPRLRLDALQERDN